ncbi:MAG: DNA primase [Candidatus Aminicenantes bacterium]|nr:DNA primase [Candidatus Aminicenantes bacterium]
MEIVERIRQSANIIDIASQYTTLKRRGNKHVGLCPFHTEKTPSFTVDEEKQLFHCFGCGTGGDIFTLVMEKESLSFPEAVKYLAQKYNIPLPQKRSVSRRLLKLEEKIYKACEDALAFFKKNLYNTNEGKEALAYLKKRGLTSDTIQTFKLGYALNKWDSLLNYFKNKNIPSNLLEKAGLVIFNAKNNSYYDRFRGRIIFPIFSLTGKVVAFGGRTIFETEPKYLNSPDTPIFSKGKLLYGLNLSKESIRKKGEVLFCEGYTDIISLYQAGITHVAASLGTSLTSDQVSLALRFSSKIIVSYDGDAAGEKAASRAVSLCFEKGAQSKVLILPQGGDPDTLVREEGAESFLHRVENSQPGLTFFIETQIKGKKPDSPEEKSRIAKTVMELISSIPDAIVRSEYLKQASEYLGLDESLLRTYLKKKKPEREEKRTVALFEAEKRLLQIIFYDKDLFEYVFSHLKEEYFPIMKSAPIFRTIQEIHQQGKEPSFTEFKEKIPADLMGVLSQLVLENVLEPTLEETKDCLEALEKYALETEFKRINSEISRLEKNGTKEKITALLSQRQNIASRLYGWGNNMEV